MTRDEQLPSLPRKVYRVIKRDGRYFVCERMLVARNGSWFTFESNGKTIKENGLKWSDSIMDAIVQEASWAMHRAASSNSLPDMFPLREQILCVRDLIEEAFEFGKLLGRLNESTRKRKGVTE